MPALTAREPNVGGGEADLTQPSSPPPTRRTGVGSLTSPSEGRPSTGNFGELSEAECKQLLTQHTAGRVGFMAAEGPQILPVTYQYRAGSVIFRTSPYGPLAGLVRRTSVAFEIDEY